jgi:aryl-alcohol dehydrogenase-like predicted oxidoreductase
MSLLSGDSFELGATRLPVTRIGLGLAALGRPGYINVGHAVDLQGVTEVDALRDRAFEVLDAAWEAGVRYFDAARSYGRAEQFLGEWLHDEGFVATTWRGALEPVRPDLPLEAARVDSGEVAIVEALMAEGALEADGTPTEPRFSVGSKWGYTYTADWRPDARVHEIKELTLTTLKRQEAESLDFLGASLGLYQIHSATLESGVLDDREVLDELAGLRSDGFAIGLSVSGASQGDTILRALEIGGFDVVQATFNILDVSAGPALQAAHDAGLGVIVKEAVANGRLTARGRELEHADITGSIASAGGALRHHARELDVSEDAIALAFVLAHPFVDVVLSGATTVEMLHSNLAADRIFRELDPDQFMTLAQPPEAYWSERAELPWN